MRGSLLVAGAVAAMLAASLAAQDVKSGIDAWQRGDHAEAVAIWRPLAERGDADASFNLGQAYRLGRGVPTNLAEAQSWLERAARDDHLEAQSTLGLLLFQNGSLRDGLRWLRTAAERGEPRALLVYGTALYNGDGVRPDPVLAYAHVSRAAAQGLAAAKDTLAQLDQVMPAEERRKGRALASQSVDRARPPEPAAVASRPEPKPTATATASTSVTPSLSGNWRIQLGAFSKPASAAALFQRLSANPPVAGRQPFLVPAGAVTRLQVGPFDSRSSASAACRVLAAKGQACFAVAAK